MDTDFIPLDYDYFDFEGRNYIRIIGRNSKGKRVCVVDTCDIYLWAILKDGVKKEKISKVIEKIEKIKLDSKGRQTRVEKVELHEKTFLGKKVKALKVFATNYKDLHDIADEIGFDEIEKRRGYDLGFTTHYIIERKIVPCNWYDISGDLIAGNDFAGISNIEVDFCLKLNKSKKIEERKFEPKIVAYDIETDDIKIGKGEILMISLVSDNFKKVITWKKTKKKFDYVEYVKDEGELLERFSEHLKKLSPDFLVGYYSDNFDLPYLKARAEENKIRLSLGLDGSEPKFSRGIELTGKIKGIVHIDLLRFIRTAYSQYMQSETMRLDDVATEFLGEGKKVFKFKHSSKIKEDEWESFFEYNLHDSVLVFRLFEKIWPDILEFSRIIQEPIFEASRNGMSKNVESYILHNLEKFDEIPEKKPMSEEISKRMHMGKYEGAFVFEPIPGIYEDIAVFDFTSCYGSTIVTYNLSKSTFLEKPEKNSYSIETPEGKLHFSKESGFFPEILNDIIEKRKKYKQELKEKPDVIKKARSNAFKLLANSAYGYQGFFGARYYLREAAAATAAFAKKLIKEVIETIDDAKYKTVYSDTDSIAFLLNGKTEKQTLDFLKKLNSQLPGIMELELEGFFRRGLWVTKRTGTIGAKKKYALLGKDGKVKIRGFETVRRDWCALARRTQDKVLRLVLDEGDEKKSLEYVKDIIKKLKQRKISIDDLIIKTQLKKSLEDYKTVSPHVIAARKMIDSGIPIDEGHLIEYYIAETEEKKKLVRDGVKLPNEKGEYDIEYYLEHQILPAVDTIFQVFGVDIKGIIEEKKKDQNRLSKWM
mgnify:CR=1 FL=1